MTDTIHGPDIAMTGSPNTVRQVSIDVRAEHLDAPLLGSLVAFEMKVKPPALADGEAAPREREVMVIGQISDARTTNRWHEDPNFKDFIKNRGKLPHLTGAADVTTGVMQVLGSYEKISDGTWAKANLSVPCRAGFPIRRVDASTITKLVANEHGYAILGDFYGARGVPAPVMTRHFDRPGADLQGGGEALIGGVFGKSGSGKTVFGLSLATIWARHSNMGFLFLDPQGEMYANKVSGETNLQYDFHAQLARASCGRFDRTRDLINISQIRLEGVDLFLRILAQKRFMGHVGVGDSKISQVVEALRPALEELVEDGVWNTGMSWDDLDAVRVDFMEPGEEKDAAEGKTGDVKVSKSFKEWLAASIASSYSAKSAGDKRKEFAKNIKNKAVVRKTWNATADRFAGGADKIDLGRVIQDVICGGRIVIVSLDVTGVALDESVKNEIVLLIFKAVGAVATRVYHTGGDKLRANAMVVLDEAHIYIPMASEDERIRAIAKDLAEKSKMLRKLSVGLMFMTQRISGIKTDIYTQMHYRIYGYGLNLGGDADSIRQMEGKPASELYAELPDPRLSKTYSYMVAGSLITLGNTGEPMFVEGFGSGNDLLEANKSLFRPWNPKPRASAPAASTTAAGERGRPVDALDVISKAGDFQF